MSDNLTEKMPGDDHLNEIVTLVRGIDTRLQSLEKKVDERLFDTRPIWENVQEQLSQQAELLLQHGELLRQQGDLLSQQGEMLRQQGEMLRQQGDLLSQQGEMLRRHEEMFIHLQDEINRLRSDMEKGFRQIGRQMDTLAGNYVRLNASLRDLEDRFKDPEPRVS